jgi:hypothetical protein
MAAVQPWCKLLGINPEKLRKHEYLILEAELFTLVCKEVKEYLRSQYKNYFFMMRFTKEMEDNMLETTFLSSIIKDILSTEEYNLTGIACYTNTHADILEEILIGRNTDPSALILQRTIELHRSVRRELYRNIVKKIYSEHINDRSQLFSLPDKDD